MGYYAKVLADSMSPNKTRLTTMEVRFPRIVLAEITRHRAFCLAGDSQLYFDLPSGLNKPGFKRFNMSIDEFYDKWHNGAAPRKNFSRSKNLDLSKVKNEKNYSAKELQELTGTHYTWFNTNHKKFNLPRIPGKPNKFNGLELKIWWETYISSETKTIRQNIKPRLENMNLRCLNEDTGEFTHTKVVDVMYSGKKEIFELTLKNGYKIKCSKDHLFLTDSGWKTLEQASNLSVSPTSGVVSWSKNSSLFSVNGRFVKKENRPLEVDDKDTSDNYKVSSDKPKTSGNKLVRKFVGVKEIKLVGTENTYDIEVEGPYHNFVANGIVVHNSFNVESSRARSLEKTIEEVEKNPFVPDYWGAHQKGMAADKEISDSSAVVAQEKWLTACSNAIQSAQELKELGLHKQLVNRVLEPYMWTTAVVSSCTWDNFFQLRIAQDAQPEIQRIAQEMKHSLQHSLPDQVDENDYHLPYVTLEELNNSSFSTETLCKMSVARCARVSYLTQKIKGNDTENDIRLFNRLVESKHMSPLEHVATPDNVGNGNFSGFSWGQLRAQYEEKS